MRGAAPVVWLLARWWAKRFDSSDWITLLFTSVVVGQSIYFGLWH